jgi:nascent polypeptide-associated complex subunit alpha
MSRTEVSHQHSTEKGGESEHDHDHDACEHHNHDHDACEHHHHEHDDCEHHHEHDDYRTGIPRRHKETRPEKKFKKEVIDMGMKEVPNIARITIVTRNNMVIVIDDCQVFGLNSKGKGQGTYVTFGHVTVEQPSHHAQEHAAQKFEESQRTMMPDLIGDLNKYSNVEIQETKEEVDETGLDPNDIELVMGQANTTRSKAIRALRNNQNDIVSAIMELTM